MVAAISQVSAQTIHTSKTVKVTVQAGDTLWSIASKMDKRDRPDEVVDAIERMNGFHDARIVPGQVIVVPTDQ